MIDGSSNDTLSSNDTTSSRNGYALQQSVIASLSQHALAGGDLQQLFDEATRLVRQVLRIDSVTVMELQSGGETLIGKAGAGWEAGVVPTIVAQGGCVRKPAIRFWSTLPSSSPISTPSIASTVPTPSAGGCAAA